jgi:hypothetical protein
MLIKKINKQLRAAYTYEKIGVPFKIAQNFVSSTVEKILNLITPSEIGLSISSEKSLDIYIKYKELNIYYNTFFSRNVPEVWLDVYKNHKSICSYDGDEENALNILENLLEN